jgi:hypothetical protein
LASSCLLLKTLKAVFIMLCWEVWDPSLRFVEPFLDVWSGLTDKVEI